MLLKPEGYIIYDGARLACSVRAVIARSLLDVLAIPIPLPDKIQIQKGGFWAYPIFLGYSAHIRLWGDQ